MNWQIFFSTFALVFLAELGDKTQLAVMLQSAVHGRRIVFLAASAALVCSVVLGVFLGGLISKVASERVIHGVGGALFLVIGGFMLHAVFKPGPDVAPIIQAVETTPAAPAEPGDDPP